MQKKTHFKLTAFFKVKRERFKDTSKASLIKTKKSRTSTKTSSVIIETNSVKKTFDYLMNFLFKILHQYLSIALKVCTLKTTSFSNLFRKKRLLRFLCTKKQTKRQMYLSMSDEMIRTSHNKQSSRNLLLRECGQDGFKRWDQLCNLFDEGSYKKLGEGAYGEVFKCKRNTDNKEVVLKVIPVEANFRINSCDTKTYSQMLNEVIISKSLSDLRDNNADKENACGDLPMLKHQLPYTNSFAKLYRVHCVEGKYPSHLLNAWILYDELKSSLNDHPLSFPDDLQYVVFECELGGQDLEQFQFANAVQAWSLLHQVVSGMAVAEKQLDFEHRDLHWGNILVCKQPHQSQVSYLHEDSCGVTSKESLCCKSNVRAIIIDFTLSHVRINNKTYYQNLELDEELFEGDSNEDEQFEVYKQMRQVLDRKWNNHDPCTNVLWVKYLVNKLLSKQYSRKSSKQHVKFMNKLKNLRKCEVEFKSCSDILKQIEKISMK